jgi:hypothetical protein
VYVVVSGVSFTLHRVSLPSSEWGVVVVVWLWLWYSSYGRTSLLKYRFQVRSQYIS